MAAKTRVLAVANQKGGVAKTTTVASLGAAMVDENKRVLLVDLDPQGCLTFSLGQDPDKLPVSVHEVLLGDVEPNAALVETAEGMTLLPANIDLAGAEAMLLMRAGREYALKRADHDLLIELRRCRKVSGLVIEIRDLEHFAAALCVVADKLRCLEFREANAHQVFAVCGYDLRLHFKNGASAVATKRIRKIVEVGIEIQFSI